jgi:MFS transporter, DHA1 family, tetracycline resistance protein
MDKKRITVIFLIVLTNAMAATAVLPMLPIYVEGEFRATPVQAMLVIAAYYAAQFIAAPWLGRLSDRFGRRPILILSQMGTLVAYLGFIFSEQLGGAIGTVAGMSGGLVVIYLARLLDGLTDGNVSVAEAYASDISDEKSRAHALGLIGGAGGLGHIVGPALAVVLSSFSLIAPMVGAIVMGVVTLLLTILLLDETLSPDKRTSRHTSASEASFLQIISSSPVALVLGTAFLTGIYIATLFSSLSLYADRVLFPDEPAEIIARNVNFMIMLVGVAAAFSQIFLIAPLVRRWGEQRLVVIGSLLLLGSALGISSGSVAVAFVAILAYALGFGLSWPSLQAIMTRLGSKETAGQRLGLFQSAFSLSFIFAPLIAGSLLEAFGAQAIFYNGALLMGLATFFGAINMHLPLPGSLEDHLRHENPAESGGLLQRFHH